MRLLITNTRAAQPYVILRCLRPHAEWVVATMHGPHRPAARISSAACSRFVDRRYYVNSPTDDWQAGRIQPENTENEEAYIHTLLQICDRERIDTIFPSHDAHMYVLAKNRARFEAHGILMPVPPYDMLLGSLDKYRTVEAARACGFPYPQTCLAQDGELEAFLDRVSPPYVLRPRFTAGSLGMEIVASREELRQRLPAVREKHGIPMIQEYVPGATRQNFYLLVDHEGEVRYALCPRILRVTQRVYRSGCAAAEVQNQHPYLSHAFRLARQLGWVGTMTLQTKIHPRTGEPNLMEVNPRVGTHLWYRTATGFNEPRQCLRVERREPVEAPTSVPVGALLLEPIEDCVAFGFEILERLIYRFRTGLLHRRPLDPSAVPPPLKDTIATYTRLYFNRRPKLYSPHFTCLRDDPLVSLTWAYTVYRSWKKALGTLGR